MNKITMSDLGEGELVSSELQDALVKIGVHFTYIGTGSTVVIENSRASDMLDNLEMTVKYSKNEEEVNQEFITLAEDWKSEYFRTEDPPLSDTSPFTKAPTVSAAAYLAAIEKHDRNAYANAVLAKVPQSLTEVVVTGYADMCRVPANFTGYIENQTEGMIAVLHDPGRYISANVRAYFLNGEFARAQLMPALLYTLSDLSPEPDDLATHIAIQEKLAEGAGLQALLTEHDESVLKNRAPSQGVATPTPPLPNDMGFQNITFIEGPESVVAYPGFWGDPVRKVQFIDTYERFIPAKPKDARDITISRALLCDGKFNEVDVELLEQEVNANYAPFQYSGEYLSAWGYEPTTDEVTLRFLKGQS